MDNILTSWLTKDELTSSEYTGMFASFLIGAILLDLVLKLLFKIYSKISNLYWHYMFLRHAKPDCGLDQETFRQLWLINRMIWWQDFRQGIPARLLKVPYPAVKFLAETTQCQPLEDFRYHHAQLINLLIFRSTLDWDGYEKTKYLSAHVEGIEGNMSFITLDISYQGFTGQTIKSYIRQHLNDFHHVPKESIVVKIESKGRARAIFPNR